jgi:ribonuclease T
MDTQTSLYIMVDCEYTGPAPGLYSLLSIGAVVVGEHRPPFTKGLYVELKPLPDAGVQPEAMDVNKLDLVRLADEGLSPAQALEKFAAWIDHVTPLAHYPVMVSDGQHDFLYLRWYFTRFNVRNPFEVPGYNPAAHGVDMKSMLVGLHGLQIADTRRAMVVAKFPEYRSEFVRTHHAFQDVIEQAERFERMLATLSRR